MNQKKKTKTKRIKGLALLLALCVAALFVMTACGGTAETAADTSVSAEQESTTGGAPEIPGLTMIGQKELNYAEQFAIYQYENGYAVFDIQEEGKFLLVPEGKDTPEGVPDEVTVLQQPKHIYLAASAIMALFASMDAMDVVTMSSLEEEDWTFDAPREAMQSGTLTYAGKYSEPDYEMLLENECDLAIESTMIYHKPDVQEMIESLGIPVLVDRSSYESNPLGRAEWIRLYGVLTGHEAEADAFFENQMQMIDGLDDFENTGLTVAFFYISTDGKAVVRSGTDYVPAMIDMAGGQYIFSDVVNETGRSSVPMSIEQFFDVAQDADIIIYNSSIDGSVKTMDDLLNKDPIMSEMKAVQEGNCWYTGSSMYQRTDIAGNLIRDFHNLFTGNTDDLEFLTKLE